MYYILYKYSEVGFVFVSLQEKKGLWNDLLFISFFEKGLAWNHFTTIDIVCFCT